MFWPSPLGQGERVSVNWFEGSRLPGRFDRRVLMNSLSAWQQPGRFDQWFLMIFFMPAYLKPINTHLEGQKQGKLPSPQPDLQC